MTILYVIFLDVSTESSQMFVTACHKIYRQPNARNNLGSSELIDYKVEKIIEHCAKLKILIEICFILINKELETPILYKWP